MSASERKMAAMEQHIAGLEVMRHEYLVLLNYLITTHNGEYKIQGEDLLKLTEIHPVKSKVSKEGLTLTLHRVDTNDDDNSLIILPPGRS